MPNIGTLVSTDTLEVEVPVANGQIVHLIMLPGKLTGEALMAISDAGKGADEVGQFDLICKVLAETVQAWDITDDDGSGNEVVLPITIETIRKFPMGFVMSIFAKMQEKANPPQTSEGSFGNG